MPKTKDQKIAAVKLIEERLSTAKAVVFSDYQGLSMKQLSDLRDKLREQNAEFSITKNTLLKRVLPSLDFDGPTAALFAYEDEISPIKILVKAFKEAALGKIKFGFLGKDQLDESKIIQLSTLPSQSELRGKTVGVLVAPLQGIVSVLQGNLRNLVYALNEYQKQKGGV